MVTNPNKLEIHLNKFGTNPTNKINKLEKIQINEYLTGILPLFKITKTIINNNNETIINPNLKV